MVGYNEIAPITKNTQLKCRKNAVNRAKTPTVGINAMHDNEIEQLMRINRQLARNKSNTTDIKPKSNKSADNKSAIWTSCNIGACHRHQDCQYMPCRNPQLNQDKLPAVELNCWRLNK